MKIGIVTPTFHPYPGGVTEHVFHTFREMSRLGHDVKIVTTSFGGGDSPIEDRVIRIGRAVPIPANGSICPVAVDPRMTASVRRVLDRERFDVIHVHEPLMPMLCLAVLAAARAPVVGTFHASNESSLGYRIWRPVLMRYYERLAARIAVSDAARASVQPFFGGEFRIIPNGVDVARFALAEPLPDLKDGSYNILFVGRLEPRKGAKYLFRAMPDILKEIPEARLTVIGGGLLAGYYRGFVPAEARERVRFLGRVPGEVLARHYATADVYCSPATGGESFGIVLLEAMAAGAAVVASDIAGYRCVIRDGETGILTKPRSPESLARAIVGLRRDEALRSRIVAAAAEAVRRYSWDRVTGEILEVLMSAALRRLGNGVRMAGLSAGSRKAEVECVVH